MQRWVIISALQGRRLALRRSRVARFTRLRGTSDFSPCFLSLALFFSRVSLIKQPPPIHSLKILSFFPPVFPPLSHFHKGTLSLTLGHSDKWRQPLCARI